MKGVTEPPSFVLCAAPCDSQQPRLTSSRTTGITQPHNRVVSAVLEWMEIVTKAVHVCECECVCRGEGTCVSIFLTCIAR